MRTTDNLDVSDYNWMVVYNVYSYMLSRNITPAIAKLHVITRKDKASFYHMNAHAIYGRLEELGAIIK